MTNPTAARFVLRATPSPARLRPRLRAAGALRFPTDLAETSFSFSKGEPRSTFECGLDDASPTTRSSAAPAERDPGTHPFEVWVTDHVGPADATPATHTWTFIARDRLKGSTVAATLD